MNTRPARPLTPDLLQALRDTPRLTFHKVLLLGLADPVPNPSPMSEEEGEWVRQNVWPQWMRTIDAPYPHGFWRWTNCQRGRCWNCMNKRCDLWMCRCECPTTSGNVTTECEDVQVKAPKPPPRPTPDPAGMDTLFDLEYP